MSAEIGIVDQYEQEFGYKPETLQKLHNFVKEKGISMKYSLVKKAFESMKEDLRTSTKPKRDTIKAATTNLDVNKSKIDIDLMPTPEAEEAEEKKKKNRTIMTKIKRTQKRHNKNNGNLISPKQRKQLKYLKN